jgi:hypothetical protein
MGKDLASPRPEAAIKKSARLAGGSGKGATKIVTYLIDEKEAIFVPAA